MNDAETIKVYDEQASRYSDRFKPEQPGGHFLRFCELLPKNGSVLDLGCGPGHHAALFAQQGYQVEALDPSSEMVALAASHPGVNAKQGTFDNLVATERYNGVWANFSLLHAPREIIKTHLLAINRALQDKGAFHIGMKIGSGDRRDDLGRYYTYYGKDELLNLLESTGFEVVWSKTGKEEGLAGTIDPWIMYQAIKIERKN